MSLKSNSERAREHARSVRGGGDAVPPWATELIEDTGELYAAVKSHTEHSRQVAARLQALEQHVANIEPGGSPVAGFGGPSAGALAAQALAEDGGLERLARGNTTSVGVSLDGTSLRAALVNEGGSDTDGGYPSQPEQRGAFGPGLRRLRLLDVLPRRRTNSDSVTFVRVNTSDSAAEQQLEGDEKKELNFAGVLTKADVATIAAHTTASRQVLSDHASLQAAINRLMSHSVLAEFERLLINGGTAGNTSRIDGLLQVGTEFVPSIGDTPADTIGESLVRMANAGFMPGLVVLNPVDWFKLQITKAAVETASYIFGSPTAPVPPALWNTSIVTTPSIEEGRAMTIDLSWTTVLDREAPRIQVSSEHGTNFTKNLVTLLIEIRGGLEIIDPASVYKYDLVSSGA